MRSFASRVLTPLAILALALPAQAREIKEIGAIDVDFDGEGMVMPTVIVTAGDKVSPTAFLLLTVGGLSSSA